MTGRDDRSGRGKAPISVIIASAMGQMLGAEPPEWIELIPAGRFMLGDGRGPYVLSDPAAFIAASLAGDGQILLDTDHGTDREGSSAAAGWIDRLELRPASSGVGSAIWGRVAWTAPGRDLVAGRIYRRISPVFAIEKKTGRAVRLLRAALVNDPAIRELSPVAASRKETEMDLSEIARALGLPEEADQPAIITAAAALTAGASAATERLGRIAAAAGVAESGDDQGEAAICAAIAGRDDKPDPAKFVPIGAVSELRNQIAALEGANARRDAEAAVTAARAAGKLAPALEDWARDYATSDLAGFTAWVASAPVIVAAGRVLNAAPPERRAGELSATEAEIAAACGVSAEGYSKTRKVLAAMRPEQEG